MKSSCPKVSIVVPVHNTSSFLKECVKSLLVQTLQDIEIILVENGSTDGSPEICRELELSDPRIGYISIDKSDLSSARNAGVDVARGEYICFVDSDDTVLPTMFEEMYEMASRDGLTMVNCNFMKRYPDGKVKYCYSQDGKREILTPKDATGMVLEGKVPVTVWANLYHRSLFERLRFPEDMYFEDRASTFRFMAESQKVGIIHKAMYVYFQRSQSIVNSRNNFRKLRDYITTDILRLDFINDSDFYPTDRDKAKVAFKTANHLVRKLTYMIFYAKTPEEKQEVKKCLPTLELIPRGTSLTLKHRLFLGYIKLWKRCN